MNFSKALILPVFLCINFISMAGDCFYWTGSMREMLKLNKEREPATIYFRGTVIGKNRHVYPKQGFHPLNIKIEHYWADKSLELVSDTLCIMANHYCGMHLFHGKEYLLSLHYQEGYFTDGDRGTNLYTHYEKDIALLGTPMPAVIRRASHEAKEQLITNAVKNEKPKRSKEEKKSQLLIWLAVSLALNFFAILLIVLLKRDKH
jgi:hypothetical protein